MNFKMSEDYKADTVELVVINSSPGRLFSD